jgi:YVTN family beta-propeller protein
MNRALVFLAGLLVVLLGVAPTARGAEDPVLLVANKNGNSLYVVDATSLSVTDSVATGEGPHEVAAAPEARRAYVANYAAGTISVIDVDEGTERDRWAVDGYSRLHGIAVGPAEEHVYVTAEAQQAVLEIDAASGDVRRVFETGKDGTHMLAVASHGNSLFATSIGSGTASKIDLDPGEVHTHTETGDGAEGVAVTPTDEAVWVTNRADDTVSILDVETADVVNSVSVSGFPIRVDFSPDGRHGVVSAPRAGAVALFNAEDARVSARLDVGEKPIGVLVPTNTRAFVANSGSGTVSVIDLETQSVVNTLSAGRGPDGMAYLSAE